MATHSSIYAWRIPGIEDPSGLPSGVTKNQTWAESEEELKNLLMTVKEESEKVGIKLNI